MAAPEGAREETRHEPPRVGFLLLVGLALVVLTAATWAVAKLLPHGAWSLPVALLIAGVKTGLVAAFFMELLYRPGGSKVMMAVALALAGTLLVLSSLETTQRFPPVIPPGPFGALAAPREAGEQSVPPNRRAPPPRSP